MGGYRNHDAVGVLSGSQRAFDVVYRPDDGARVDVGSIAYLWRKASVGGGQWDDGHDCAGTRSSPEGPALCWRVQSLLLYGAWSWAMRVGLESRAAGRCGAAEWTRSAVFATVSDGVQLTMHFASHVEYGRLHNERQKSGPEAEAETACGGCDVRGELRRRSLPPFGFCNRQPLPLHQNKAIVTSPSPPIPASIITTTARYLRDLGRCAVRRRRHAVAATTTTPRAAR